MRYKLINKILLVGIIFCTSCDDWLDVKSTTEVDMDELFKTEIGYSEALVGIYSKLCDVSLYGRHLSYGVIEVMAGRYDPIWSSSYQYFRETYPYKKSDVNDYNYTSAVSIVDNFWKGIYEQIANLNSILKTIDGNEEVFLENNYSVIKGEAIGLRAFLHFEILRMFAPSYTLRDDEKIIPFVSELTPLVSPLLSFDEFIDIIIKELESAVELLAKDPMYLGTTPSNILASPPPGHTHEENNIFTWHNRRFHFNYYAAKATLARVYLWKGDKTNALKSALDVIADQETRFPWARSSNQMTQDRTYSTEQIFALNVVEIENYILGHLLRDGQDYSFQFPANVECFENIWDDNRRQYHFRTNSSEQECIKFEQVSSFRYFKERIPIIRISEMYYIAAECVGVGAEGVNYLNTIRDNRGLTAHRLNTNMDAARFEEEIMKEYQKELFAEGQLWFYYKRKNHSSITNTLFNDVSRYTFDRPEGEDAYR